MCGQIFFLFFCGRGNVGPGPSIQGGPGWKTLFSEHAHTFAAEKLGDWVGVPWGPFRYGVDSRSDSHSDTTSAATPSRTAAFNHWTFSHCGDERATGPVTVVSDGRGNWPKGLIATAACEFVTSTRSLLMNSAFAFYPGKSIRMHSAPNGSQ